MSSVSAHRKNRRFVDGSLEEGLASFSSSRTGPAAGLLATDRHETSPPCECDPRPVLLVAMRIP